VRDPAEQGLDLAGALVGIEQVERALARQR
jgi:hypothetical protein